MAEKSPVQHLPPQRRKFVEAYVLSFNATKSAQEAGYSEKTARQQGSRLLTSVDIQAAIKYLLKECMSPEEVAARWQRLATANLADFYTRVKVEYKPRIEKKLAQVVEEYRKNMEFEQEVAIRSEAVILDRKKREKFREREKVAHERRELHLVRLEVQLENDPDAVCFVDGPKQWKYEMQLDLAKAEALGLLDLVASITSGPRGTSFTLRDQDAALVNLAKHRGMLTNKIDVTSGGESLAPTYDPAELAKKLSPEQLAALRAAHQTLSHG
ncbi:terminase small subunit [Hymenobacter metallilatus]|uniref:Terminase small subunit n=1 Tax=Hymenobacter metallilatus TaxID=2493666 RepID=A0A3R9NPT7_9BACT|nr:terminase small subunit [Hymenobacter metallilatus]RSK33945.1 terminase small subunit [Hymenobacter metallilatus]